MLRGADLRGARLRRANLSSTNLEDADLEGADLTGADLFDANFDRANLKNAVLREAIVHNTKFRGAHLDGADFTGAFCLFAQISREDRSKIIGSDAFNPRNAIVDFDITAQTESELTDHTKLHLFLSYHRTQRRVARALERALKDLGHVCFSYLATPIDAPGPKTLEVELIRRVTASDALVIVESHKSSESEWVRTELTVANNHFRRYVLVVAETTGRLAVFNNPSRAGWGHDFVYDSHPAEAARRVLEILCDDRRWGAAQRLRWIVPREHQTTKIPRR